MRSPGFGRGLALYYMKRLDRVLLTTWVGMTISLSYPKDNWPAPYPGVWRIAQCYLQVAPYLNPSWDQSDHCKIRTPSLPS